jgi:hypothetical protein
MAAAEEALALSIWTTATVCRALSLESVCCITPIFQLLWKALMLYIILKQILSYKDKKKSCKGFAKHNKMEAAQ